MMAKTFRFISVFCFFILAVTSIPSIHAQPVIAGLKIGVPLTGAFSVATGSATPGSVFANANDYTLGPFVEVKLPFQLSIEADALYRGYTLSEPVATSHPSSWDFPIVAKYHFFKGPVKPYVEGGLDFSHLSNVASTFGPNHSANFGIVLGAGIQVNALVLRLSPEIRYTGDTLKNFSGLINSNQNQVAFLVGIGF